ncbi:MAG: DtxR family transcriptional regulator, Mn-dependent transcriptional regulator [Solirubrobacteraceae bacterium]|jgi:DtxR family Mn-dependent transcriptional regulator|nr:DtxR family transcriptional regulator, Mn-dependent transcriptional regulator [Solirubrobacteraceae bacterium]
MSMLWLRRWLHQRPHDLTFMTVANQVQTTLNFTAMPTAEEYTAAVEDYAKAIYALEHGGEQAVGTSALARRMAVSAASASAMVKRLAELGLVEHVPYHGVRLTPGGARLALEVIRHHRLLETYLAEHLGVPWDRVHAEAEVLEHALSEELEELIAAKLGYPTHDPHGDPIPDADLRIDELPGQPLTALKPGARGVLARVSDSDPAMLRYLGDLGIALGDPVEVLAVQPFDGPIELRVGDAVHVLGGSLAAAMRIEVDG